MVYVQNKYTSDIKLNLTDGGKTTSVIFKRYQVDRLTGQVVESGYTQVDDELEAKLQESKGFKGLVASGKLILCKEVPLTVNTLEKCMQLQSENASLKQQIKQLQLEIAGYKKAAQTQAEIGTETVKEESEPAGKKKGKK